MSLMASRPGSLTDDDASAVVHNVPAASGRFTFCQHNVFTLAMMERSAFLAG